jgi:hypothetical protein
MEFAILFLISVVIVITYNVLSYLEMRFIQTEYKSVKEVVKESIIMMLACLAALTLYTKYENYFVDFFAIIMNKSSSIIGTQLSGAATTGGGNNLRGSDIPVFTDSPDF